MTITPPAPSLVVIYAQDLQRVAAFYERTLAYPATAADVGFIVIGGATIEVAIVQSPEALVPGKPLATPPRLREETPVKPSFLVDDLDRVVGAAAASGGGTKPLATAWRWRGQLHLDGYDPEGNPIQFRVCERVTLPSS